MNPQLLNACKTFSLGDAPGAKAYLSPDVKWEFVGEKTMEGLEAMLQFCREMMAEGCPDFRIERNTISDSRVVIEGKEDREGGICYCDSFTLENGLITEIYSYCICPGASSVLEAE